MKPNWFIMLTKKGCIEAGVFPEIPWHKKEKEDIIHACGLEIEYEPPSLEKKATDRGTYKTVSDQEHSEMVQLRVEGLSIHKIAKELNRSTHTPHEQFKEHNKSIERVGYCPRCRHVEGEFETTKV